MMNDKGSRTGSAATMPQDNWSLKGEDLSRRVPRFAAFVEPHAEEASELTDSQRKSLDTFSSKLTEAISEKTSELIDKGFGDSEKT